MADPAAGDHGAQHNEAAAAAAAEEGGEAEAAAAESEPVVDIASLPKFSLSLLAHIKAAQLQNGLRHNNYQKYRRYCANRLKTLRHRVKFSHRAPKVHPGSDSLPTNKKGKQHKGGAHMFQPRRLAADFQDLQYPHIALVNAERAWAYAMQLKQDSENVDNPRLRFHSLQRLRKAAFWSQKLAELASLRGDERTSLECDAYAAWLAGSAAMESDNWEDALANFVKTQTIYKQLLQVSSVVEQDLFSRRLQEVGTQVEFIQYKIDLSHGHGSSAGLIAKMTAATGASGGLGVLQSKLDMVLEEERQKNTATLSRVEWCGHHIPIDNDRVRMTILHAKDTALQLEKLEASPESEEYEDIYFDLMARFDDAQQLVDRDVAGVSKVTLKADEVKLQMELLRSYIKSSKLEHTVEKNTAMINLYAERWRQQQRGFGSDGASSGKAVQATDVVKLHDALLQNTLDAQALPGADNDIAFLNRFRFKHGAFSTSRCFYVAETLFGRGQYTQAYALYERGLQTNKELLGGNLAAADREDVELLRNMEADLEGGKCRSVAQNFLERQSSGEGKEHSANTFLLARPNEYRKTSAGDEFPFSVAPVPPRADPVPCKPLFFDLVRDDLPVPPTRHLAQATSAASSPLHSAGGAAAGRAADDSDDFESVEGSDSDSSDDESSSDDDAGAATPAAAATDGAAGAAGGGGLLGAARKWFGK